LDRARAHDSDDLPILARMGTRWPMLLFVALAVGGIAASKAPNPADTARAFVDAHNAVRAGVTQPAGYKGAWAPIPPLAWSDEIAATSQEWANHLRDDNKCKLVHYDSNYGENLAMGKGLDIAGAVDMWASEGKRYRYTPIYEWDIPTGHYTQVVWRKTTQVGCGIASCGKTVVMVCRYSPPGNHIGKSPY
jgi:pathogenesis-related protein 1